LKNECGKITIGRRSGKTEKIYCFGRYLLKSRADGGTSAGEGLGEEEGDSLVVTSSTKVVEEVTCEGEMEENDSSIDEVVS